MKSSEIYRKKTVKYNVNMSRRELYKQTERYEGQQMSLRQET
jgi:hypothetical protein